MDALRHHFPDASYHRTEKLFYSKYPFRITVKRRSGTALQNFVGEHVAVARTNNLDFRTRLEGTEHLILFLLSVEDALFLVRETAGVHSMVTNIACPGSAAQLAAMFSDTKVRIRKTLYWQQYRWKVSLSWATPELREETFAWLKDTFGDSKERCLAGTDYPRVFYFRDENDLILFKLVYGEQFFGIEKAVLLKEVNDQSHFAA